MNGKNKPSASQGALVGFILTVPFLAIFFISQAWFGTPFVPFDLFDWLARILPGGLVAFGIDMIVSIIAGLNLENTSSTAKTGEHILAMLIVIAAGSLIGAVLFARWRNPEIRERRPSGLMVGAAVGVFAALITAGVNQSASANPFISLIWIVMVFAGWGTALESLYERLTALPDAGTAPAAEVKVLDRRRFLIQVGGAAAVFTVIGAGLGTLTGGSDGAGADEESSLPVWSDSHKLPNADDALLPAPGTRPEFTRIHDHYRIDINSLPPVVHENDWTLLISGLVDNQIELTLDDLRTRYKPVDQFVTLSCISNPLGGDLIGTQRWTGVPLRDILKDVKPKAEAISLKITCADGFDESLSLAKAMNDERIMLTYAWDGQPLPTSHGFPLRIYIPDVYGMKQPKWIVAIEVSNIDEEGYWVRRGWDEVAKVNTTSVIDTIAGDQLVQSDGGTFVPIGGIAYAGKRGISKVEVRVDDGEWVEAKLRSPLSETTWVIWRYDWPFVAGDHLVYVRCYDGTSAKQSEIERGERPSGATGIFRKYSRL